MQVTFGYKLKTARDLSVHSPNGLDTNKGARKRPIRQHGVITLQRCGQIHFINVLPIFHTAVNPAFWS